MKFTNEQIKQIVDECLDEGNSAKFQKLYRDIYQLSREELLELFGATAGRILEVFGEKDYLTVVEKLPQMITALKMSRPHMTEGLGDK